VQREKSGVPLPHRRPVVPWNKGRFIGPKPPLKPKQVWAIRLHLQREERLRDLAMFDLAVDSKLRGCDLVRLRTGQLVVNATPPSASARPPSSRKRRSRSNSN
jgi:hypothetical protein